MPKPFTAPSTSPATDLSRSAASVSLPVPTESSWLVPATAGAPSHTHRRKALGTLGSLGLMALTGCGGGGSSSDSSSSSSTSSTASSSTDSSSASSSNSSGTASGSSSASSSGSSSASSSTDTTTTSCTAIPEETAGPYPADGSTASNQTYNVLALSGIVRSDIRSNIGSSTVLGGVPLTLTLTLINTNQNCASLAGYAIYLWHCSREGTYSVYSTSNLSDNAFRGVQATNSSGQVTFTTIVPGCYAGRMPHMHLEVYPSLAKATNASNKIKTSQLAFPTDTLKTVYSSASGYSASVSNLAAISFATDNVFSDGYALEMVSLSGKLTDGYKASITVAIAA